MTFSYLRLRRGLTNVLQYWIYCDWVVFFVCNIYVYSYIFCSFVNNTSIWSCIIFNRKEIGYRLYFRFIKTFIIFSRKYVKKWRRKNDCNKSSTAPIQTTTQLWYTYKNNYHEFVIFHRVYFGIIQKVTCF